MPRIAGRPIRICKHSAGGFASGNSQAPYEAGILLKQPQLTSSGLRLARPSGAVLKRDGSVNFPFSYWKLFVIQGESKRNDPQDPTYREAFMAKTWNAPVLEELSIPAGTLGATPGDDAGTGANGFYSQGDNFVS